MAAGSQHKWMFAPSFRRHAFGWRSQPAIRRIREAVSEIKKVARIDPILAAEGAVLLLEKLSPALEQVDSSSGAIGTAVNHAIDALVSVIAKAPADDDFRNNWLERLWNAIQEDEMPYIENLTDFWGELCASSRCASKWADNLIGTVRMAWSPDPALRGYFKGTTACLSALLKAGRNEEILQLLELAPHKFWHDRQWGVKALVAMGRNDEALRYGEDSRGLNDSPILIARACEQILLSCGLVNEAYERYALEANQQTTYLATFRAITNKYPHKDVREILHDLVARSPGDEGRWFAAAKSAGLYREAIDLANRSPCDPKTLIRAARDLAATEPQFAIEAGMAALKWLAGGYGYEITAMDVWEAFRHSISAAEQAGCKPETVERIRQIASTDVPGGRFVLSILGPELGWNQQGKRS